MSFLGCLRVPETIENVTGNGAFEKYKESHKHVVLRTYLGKLKSTVQYIHKVDKVVLDLGHSVLPFLAQGLVF